MELTSVSTAIVTGSGIGIGIIGKMIFEWIISSVKNKNNGVIMVNGNGNGNGNGKETYKLLGSLDSQSVETIKMLDNIREEQAVQKTKHQEMEISMKYTFDEIKNIRVMLSEQRDQYIRTNTLLENILDVLRDQK